MNEPKNPLSEMGSNLFVRRYKDNRGIWHEERQVNLGGQQGTVTYVHVNDYEAAKNEIDRLIAELEVRGREVYLLRAQLRKHGHAEAFFRIVQEEALRDL